MTEALAVKAEADLTDAEKNQQDHEMLAQSIEVARKLWPAVGQIEAEGEKYAHIVGGLIHAAYHIVRHTHTAGTAAERQEMFTNIAAVFARNFEDTNKPQ